MYWLVPAYLSSITVTVFFTSVFKLLSVPETLPRALCHSNGGDCDEGETRQALSLKKVGYEESAGEWGWDVAQGQSTCCVSLGT